MKALSSAQLGGLQPTQTAIGAHAQQKLHRRTMQFFLTVPLQTAARQPVVEPRLSRHSLCVRLRQPRRCSRRRLEELRDQRTTPPRPDSGVSLTESLPPCGPAPGAQRADPRAPPALPAPTFAHAPCTARTSVARRSERPVAFPRRAIAPRNNPVIANRARHPPVMRSKIRA